jgi:hypothetical protein
VRRNAEMLPMMFALTAFVVNLIVMTGVFYVAGIIVVGGKRALLSDAFVISLLGTILGSICTLFIPLIGAILSFIVWLLLIRHYYETGWLGALAVAILAVIIYVVVLLILAFFLAVPLLLLRRLSSLLRAVIVQEIF